MPAACRPELLLPFTSLEVRKQGDQRLGLGAREAVPEDCAKLGRAQQQLLKPDAPTPDAGELRTSCDQETKPRQHQSFSRGERELTWHRAEPELACGWDGAEAGAPCSAGPVTVSAGPPKGTLPLTSEDSGSPNWWECEELC